jgi:hypothetical protein
MIKLHPGQSRVYSDLFVKQKTRYATVNCSRGFGKSYLAATAAMTAVAELMDLHRSVPNKDVYVIAPTFDQVTDIYYPLLAYDLGAEETANKSSRDTGRFWFPNNVNLRLLSYEAVERMRGKGSYFTVWDEVASCRKGIDPREAWESVIQPTMTTRWSPMRARMYGARSPGRALIIGTPKGYDYFHTLCHQYESDPMWSYYHYDYTQSPYLDAEEIEKAKANLDPIKFASEYLASFAESGNSVFYMFDRKTHVRELEDFKDGEDVHVGIDFNVGLQCSNAFAIRGKQVHILQEFKGHPDTESLAISLKTRFEGKRIYAYPDPTGRARKSSAPVGRTDFSILESYGIQCLARTASPPIVDSAAAVNRLLKNARNDVNLFVSPKCRGVIESLERTVWLDNNPNTATIDKSKNVEHFSDGVRYPMEYLFPVDSGVTRNRRGFGF